MASGMSLSSDIVAEILRRTDGITLAKAGCCCSDLRSIANEESLWEDACRSLWPSTRDEGVQRLISSLGGFKKFYADCFPLINVSKHLVINSKEDYQKIFNPNSSVQDDEREDHEVRDDTVSLSDFVSVVDIHYNNKAIFSKVEWQIPSADDIIYCRSSTIFPLVIDLPCDISGHGTLLSISTSDIKGEEDTESKTLSSNLRLSWILISRRTKHAVNLSSWRPLEVQKHNWGSENYFRLRFGSILPAHNWFPLKLAACNIEVRCRVATMNLQISGVSMQLEDMMGCEVNERECLLILQRAVEWGKRSNDHDRVIQSCQDMLEVQSDLMEEKLDGQCYMDPFCILFSIVIAALSCYYFLL